MKFLNRLSHQLVNAWYARAHRSFRMDRKDFKKFQKDRLESLVGERDWHKYSGENPLTSYKDYEDRIVRQRAGEGPLMCPDCDRWQPTSGSTSSRKWIPYSKALTREFDQAIGPWLADIYRTFPGVSRGRHYWSLSWLPDDLRGEIDNLDDLNVFEGWQKKIMAATMATPSSISFADTSKAATMATLAWLVCQRDLSMISVWSPTFALNLLDELRNNREELVKITSTGFWGPWNKHLRKVPCPQSLEASAILRTWKGELDGGFFERLWPGLSLVSAWDTSTSRMWADRLRSEFPWVPFQGKGLFATEAVVTIPFQGRYQLAYKSHFYEFECAESGKVHPSWELQKDQRVIPVVTTGSGFRRYRMSDVLKVTSYCEGLPCLDFEGRLFDIDLVGEKMSPEFVIEMFSGLDSFRGLCLFAVVGEKEKPFYLALLEGKQEKKLESWLENELRKNFHYGVARDIGQLERSRVVTSQEPRKLYEEVIMKKGMIKGDIKMEVLVKVDRKDIEGVLI